MERYEPPLALALAATILPEAANWFGGERQ
jgi:hypothetical protein